MAYEVVLTGKNLGIEDIHSVAVEGAKASLSEGCRPAVEASCRLIEAMVLEDKPVYGVNTGVGPLCNRLLPRSKTEALQRNLVRALSAGVGRPLPAQAVRATMLARANSFLQGRSGIRWGTIQALVDLLNHRIHPMIPETGSVGASGDLAHLGHMALGLMGEGQAEYKGRFVDSREALSEEGLNPVSLASKEGLALVNGTAFMTGVGSLCSYQTEYLATIMELCTAFLVEVFGRSLAAFDLRIHGLKPYPGQTVAARNILRFARNSKLTMEPEQVTRLLEQGKAGVSELVKSSEAIQDPYSIRCVPQVTGAVRDHLNFIQDVLRTELNSVNDNPLIFAAEKEVAHGGNFLGQHVAFAMDTLSLLLSQLATLSERQFARLIDENFNFDLSPMLISGEAGLQSGFMPVQLVTTSISATIRVRAAPASLHSIPTNANNQDIVTMGGIAALKNVAILEDLASLLSIELIGLAQAADIKGRSQDLGEGTRRAYEFVRDLVPFLDEDRSLSEEIQELATALAQRRLPVG